MQLNTLKLLILTKVSHLEIKIMPTDALLANIVYN